MQFDMFGGDSLGGEDSSLSVPVAATSGVWQSPEVLALSAALRAGALGDAIALLKNLKRDALGDVLLKAGFQISSHKDRKELLADVGPEIVSAARLGVDGYGLRAARAGRQVSKATSQGEDPFETSFDSENDSTSFMAPVAVGDFVTHEDGFNYVVDSIQGSGDKAVRLIRPVASMEGANNAIRVVQLPLSAVMITKQRYALERAQAVKSDSEVFASSDAYSALIEAGVLLQRDLAVRLNGLVYRILSEGEAPSSLVDVERLESGDAARVRVLASIPRAAALAARRAYFPDVASFNPGLARLEVPVVAYQAAPPITLAQAEAVSAQAKAITLDSVASLDRGMRVIDSQGIVYEVFGARQGYVQVFPIGANGRAEVLAGNAVFFHLDPGSAPAFEDRRHDPIYFASELLPELEVTSSENLIANPLANSSKFVHSTFIDNAGTSPQNLENANGQLGQRSDVRERPGFSDLWPRLREGEQPLDARLARADPGADQIRSLPGTLGRASGEGAGRVDGGRFDPAPPGGSGASGIGGNFPSTTGVATRTEGLKRVGVPQSISEALAADLGKQKSRLSRLRSASGAPSATLEQRVGLQEKATVAAADLFQMRSTIFQVEDEALSAIDSRDAALFNGRSLLFPLTAKALEAHVASLPVEVLSEARAPADPHVGRSFNTIWGRATIVSLVVSAKPDYGMPALYEYKTEDGSYFRVDEDRIEATIARLEHDATPEGRAETEARRVAFDEEQIAVKAAQEKAAALAAALNARLDGFISKTNLSPMKAGLARKMLLTQVRHGDELLHKFEFVEKLLSEGYRPTTSQKDRIAPLSHRAFNRASDREQADHEARRIEAGKKTVYELALDTTSYEIGAFEFSYANFLGQVQDNSLEGQASDANSAPGSVGVPADGLVLSSEADVSHLVGLDGMSAQESANGRFLEGQELVPSPGTTYLDPAGVPSARWPFTEPSNASSSRANFLPDEYPFGHTAVEDRFHGSRVRVNPELLGDVAWEGTVTSVLNNGRLITVKRDDFTDAHGQVYQGLPPIRIAGSRVDVLELRDAEAVLGPSSTNPTLMPVSTEGDLDQGGDASRIDGGIDTSSEPLSSLTAAEFFITDADRIGLGGAAEKFRDNLRAIQITRELSAQGRAASLSEMGELARYVGWGGLKGVFDPANKQWARQHEALRALLTDQEWDAARRSMLNAHYTSTVVVESMFSAVERLGFDAGRILEPSVGVGNFFGMMPPRMRGDSELHGVELDSLTSQIVAALYPSAKIAKGVGFQQFDTPLGYFDMVIGNPPFGAEAIVDSQGSPYSGWSQHNYFFAKSIDMLRPGGIMPMVVSHNFLDKLDPHVRQWIARRAELVSGVRLPNTAFKENANTEVVTDILVFRRLDFENTLGESVKPDWLETTDIKIENPKTGEHETFAVNNYFLNNPQNVLGVQSATGSMYRANEYTVEASGELSEQLAQWVKTLPEGIYKPLDRAQEAITSLAKAAPKNLVYPELVKEGSFFVFEDKVYRRLNDAFGEKRAELWEPPNQRAMDRMKGMIEIRDVLRQQIRLERSPWDENDIEAGRKNLNQVYDRFKKQYGFVNDSVNARLFHIDTESPLVQSLEFNYEKAMSEAKAAEFGVEPSPAKAAKADIFLRRVLFPPGEIEVVQTAKDALLHSLNIKGGVDMAYMQQAYGKSEAEMVAELGDLLFLDPQDGLVTSDCYLSGDVKKKLDIATKAVAGNTAFSRNIDALKAVIPKDKLPSEIHAAIGAAWISPKVYEEFAHEISGGKSSYVHLSATGNWFSHGRETVNFVKNNTEFGTDYMGALDILLVTMNSRAPEIKKSVTVDDRTVYVTDEEKTEAVRQKADKIKTHWDSWLWMDASRADELAETFNERFNRSVERKFDGSHLTFPGMSPSLSLLGHQKNGVWRGLQDRVMLMDKVVGAGKTYEIVAMIMEMRRLGIAKKPLVVVPNHLTLQWRTEFYKLYPGGNVLAAMPQDFEKENRKLFFAKITTGSWDAVILGHSSLKKLQVPLESEQKIIQEQFNDLSSAIETIKSQRGDRNVVRDMEKIKMNLENKLAKLKEKGGNKDKVVDFGDLGIDALFVDEMHEFKNLFFSTQMNRVAGLGNPAGSGKAFDLFVKTRWLQETYGEQAPLITATGTPISNSLAEMFTMQRFMQYTKLKSNGLHVFDTWAKQYGDVQNVYEVAPSGTGYRLSQRFAKFKNLSSLMGEYRSFSDVITLDDLKAQERALGRVFPVPKLEGGKPQNVVADRSDLQVKFFGVPEIERGKAGEILFELDVDLPIRVEKTSEGKFSVVQTDTDQAGEAFDRFMPRQCETEQEAAYMAAVAAVTPKMTIDPESIVGQFENLRELTRMTKGRINALSLTGLANKAGLDYRIIDANAPDFPDSKVNKAVANILANAQQWDADKGTQLVFCDLSVPLSAKARMASKEKRIYVRDLNGRITHKKGTLHPLKGFDGLSYFMVAEGKGPNKTFTMYDPLTGVVLKDGLDSKLAGQELASRLLSVDGGIDRWVEMREKMPEIAQDEIDDYKNEHALDAEGDAADLEFSLVDVEGASGVAGFSIYDDMKAKLVAGGFPAHQIEFIHDHDSPQAKDLLFKRVNAGAVRVLFGSTPKMGAGTNVQERLVALHHIDAPWRPSDLEQREGRIIRRGNHLYARDPDGFQIKVLRYATAQTYDTRRWQLLEHKAAGLEQLRNYAGQSEIDDVASEAANSSDMKAAASGNPLILKETQLASDVKKLKLLENAHRDGDHRMRALARQELNYATSFGPNLLSGLEALKLQVAGSEVLGIYGARKLETKEAVMEALDDIKAGIGALGGRQILIYRGLKFEFERDVQSTWDQMKFPDDSLKLLDVFSRSGIATRMENWCNGIDGEIESTKRRIALAAEKASEIQASTGKPFEHADSLQQTIREHAKVQRALMQSNALAAVKPEDQLEFAACVAVQKAKLKAMGFSEAVDEMERGAEADVVSPGVSSCGPTPELGSSLRSANEIVRDGSFNGAVVRVADGLVEQRVDRAGTTVCHDLANLSADVAVGDVVEVHYYQGVGRVSGVQRIAMGR